MVVELGGNSIGDTIDVLCNTKGLEGVISIGGLIIGWPVGVDATGESPNLCCCGASGSGGGGGGGGGTERGWPKTLLILAFRPLEIIIGDAPGLFSKPLPGDEEAEDTEEDLLL